MEREKLSEVWDHSQDSARLFLPLIAMIVAPEGAAAFKIAPIAIGVINRALKMSGVLKSKQTVSETIESELQAVFRSAWEATIQSLDKDTQRKLSEQLQSVLAFNIGDVSHYTDTELKAAFDHAISDKSRYVELCALDSDFRSVYETFFRFYEQEVKGTKELRQYLDHEKIVQLFYITAAHEERLNQHDQQIADNKARIDGLEGKGSLDKYLTNLPPDPKKDILYRDTQIHDLLSAIRREPKARLLLHGFGGIGKSTVAAHLFYALQDEFKHLAWIQHGKSLQESMLKSFTIYPEITNENVRLERLRVLLNHSTLDTLIILDNVNEVDQNELLQLQGIGAKIMITSRAPEISGYDPFEIGFMDEVQCVEVFYHYYKMDKERAHQETVRKLVALTRYHTLSVELLARAAKRLDYDLDTYLKELTDKGFQYPDLSVYTGHGRKEAVVAEHIRLLFDMMDVSEEQSYILKNFSVMPEITIPAEVRVWLDCNINDLHKLISLGWLAESESGYAMHHIVKVAIGLQYEVAYDDCKKIMDYMSGNEYIRSDDIYTDVRIRLDMAYAFLKRFESEESKDFARLCNRIALSYASQGDYHTALEWHQKALAIREKVLGKEHPDTAVTYNNIAFVYHNQGDYPNALEWYQKDLSISEKVLGKEHPSTATSYNNIAGVYYCQGDYPAALKWYQKALAIREKVLGKEHPATATIYNNIAGIYNSQGDYPKALEWYQKALVIREKVLGKEHPAAAMIYNNIAGVYDNQCDYPKALEWFLKALAIREKVLGKEHPDTAITYSNIALEYHRQGDYFKALEWYQKALAIHEKVLGKEHPNTATTYDNIGGVYHSQGDYPAALEWTQKALAIREKVLGKEHPDTAMTYNNIGGVYHCQGDYPKALEWCRNALAIREKVLGKEHPDTATSYNNIASVYYNQGDFLTALEWYQKLLDIMEKMLINDHHSTKTVREKMELIQDRLRAAEHQDQPEDADPPQDPKHT